MRVYFYILSGISSALIGWSIAQVILSDFGWLKQFPQLVLFPCVAISLAVGTVATEIFLSNPTRRPKFNLRISKIPLVIAAGLGLLIGLVSGGIAQLLFAPETRNVLPIAPNGFFRIVGWVLIGAAVGIAEGFTWHWRSTEAGDRKRFWQRFWTSIIAGSSAAFLAALIFEALRSPLDNLPPEQKGIEDVIGFSLLGFLLGAVFSKATSPSYMAALRAGAGFEYADSMPFESGNGGESPTGSTNYPVIQRDRDGKPLLKFVSNSNTDKIEEGLSIQLPVRGAITIGSGNVHIRIPGLPPHAATLDLQPRKTELSPNIGSFNKIEVKGKRLNSEERVVLKHNDILTFHVADNQEGANGKKFFRFVYYNRFLDPQA